MVSLPAAMTFGLPLTGAARKSVPCAGARRADPAEASGETVEESTMTFGAQVRRSAGRPRR